MNYLLKNMHLIRIIGLLLIGLSVILFHMAAFSSTIIKGKTDDYYIVIGLMSSCSMLQNNTCRCSTALTIFNEEVEPGDDKLIHEVTCGYFMFSKLSNQIFSSGSHLRTFINLLGIITILGIIGALAMSIYVYIKNTKKNIVVIIWVVLNILLIIYVAIIISLGETIKNEDEFQNNANQAWGGFSYITFLTLVFVHMLGSLFYSIGLIKTV